MNIVYTITWPASDTEDLSRQTYEQIRAAVASGIRFPFDSPYEVGMLHATAAPDATPPACNWAVAVLAMRVTTTEVGASVHTLPELERWFQECIPGGLPPGSNVEHAEATHLKLASELRSDYDVVSSFGTFVGEPEPETGASQPPQAPAEDDALSEVADLLDSVDANEAIPEAAPEPPAIPPVAATPPIPPARPVRNDNQTFSTCLGIGLIGGGLFLIPTSLMLAALLAFGQFSTDPDTGGAATTTIADFLLFLACCPLPLLMLGIGLILLGVYIPRWIKKNQ